MFAATFFAQPPAFAQAEAVRSEPGEGVICAWAIYSAMAEVGARCHPDEDADVQAELTLAVARLDAYVIANTTPPATIERIAEFKREQGMAGAPKEQLCRGAPEEMYKSVAARSPAEIRKTVDDLVARAGPPTWGTCL